MHLMTLEICLLKQIFKCEEDQTGVQKHSEIDSLLQTGKSLYACPLSSLILRYEGGLNEAFTLKTLEVSC